MKSANSFAKQLKRFVKEGNSTYNKSSILKNIKIQNIYSNDKINKKEHYIYFKEQDIKPNDLNYTHLKKTKRLFKNGANKNKNVFMYTTISSSVGIVLFVFYMSSKWNNNNY
ncbi:conserved Plasmodium protein, unknown function [Plasmodium chabaudi adami]|uniref:Uncharacterized protein n=1 Tax=Plasmodium chabaudi adami TaxID=5826 RepID=A0A1C6XV81_PLACE|nr:conserved Plasmodium protein, unknown function [Plasmodium chabaudi adami]